MIDTKLWEVLDAFATSGTLTAAAEKLHTSQPALTRSMKKLEDELGVTLFIRGKNYLKLNATGEKAAAYARQFLLAAEDLEARIRAYDRSLHTLTIGFCAPIPQQVLTPIISAIYNGMTLAFDMSDDALFLDRLDKGIYQLAVLHEMPKDPKYCSKKIGHEDLYISLIPQHPLASRKTLQLNDINGLSVLLLSDIGFWANMHQTKTPETRYLHQRNMESFQEIASLTPYPIFTSSYLERRSGLVPGRVTIPIEDPEAHTDYYLVCLVSEAEKYRPLFNAVNERTIW